MPTEKVMLSGVLITRGKDGEIVKVHLPLHIRQTRAEPGCLAFDVVPDPDNAAHYLVEEVFASKAAFEAHQMRVKDSDWGKVTAHMERQYIIKNVRTEL